MINPMIVEGQVHGGGSHGLGNATLEEVVYDLPAPATIANAVADALGIAITEMPLTRERLWRRLRHANVVQ